MNTTETKTTIKERLTKGGYEAACAELKKEPLTLDQFNLLYKDEKRAHAFYSLEIVTTMIEALKEGRKFDYNNNDEYKHYPWFDMETYDDAPAGSRFSLHDVLCDYTDTVVGARLSSFSESEARFVAELVPEHYKNWMKE